MKYVVRKNYDDYFVESKGGKITITICRWTNPASRDVFIVNGREVWRRDRYDYKYTFLYKAEKKLSIFGKLFLKLLLRLKQPRLAVNWILKRRPYKYVKVLVT